MIKIADLNISVDTNPYKFKHYHISEFSLYVNGKRVASHGLTLDMYHKKTSVIGYRTLVEVSGVHHSNSGQQITHDMYINGYFILLFVLTPDSGASVGHTSLPENGNIRIELLFTIPLPVSITCLPYLEYDSTVLVNLTRKITTDF